MLDKKLVNLQLLAEQTGGVEGGQEPDTGSENNKGAEGTEGSEKLYTQADTDSLIASSKATWRKKELPPKEELEAFRAWQAEQRAKEPVNSEAETARKELAAAQAELTAYKNREAAIKAGIDVKYADFVTYEVSKLVNDETDFDVALQQFVKTNEQFKAGANGAAAEGFRHGSSGSKTDGVEDAFLAMNPKLKGKI